MTIGHKEKSEISRQVVEPSRILNDSIHDYFFVFVARPRYIPHFGQALCGMIGALQEVQILVVTGLRAMCEAPRRTEELDFRRAGTGIGVVRG